VSSTQPGTGATPQRARPRTGDELELRIDRLAHGGAGVARSDGYVVFVRGGVPGDLVRARITKSKRSFGEANTVELLEPSPERIEPEWPHPGAPWQVLPYERQLREKEEQVRDALERIGHFESPPVRPIVAAEERVRYRNKVEYSFGADAAGQLVLGFHRPGRWDLIDDVERDILASERVDELRDTVKAWFREAGLTAWDRRDGSGLLRNLVVREGRRSGELQARLVTSAGELRDAELAAAMNADSVLWTQASGVAENTREGTTAVLKGRAHLEEHICGLRFKVSPDAFFQTNTVMAERLYGIAAELAGLSGRERVLDLFCGIGTIASVLALDAGEVWGVEIVEQAVADAIDNARMNDIDNVSFFAGDVRTAMRPLLERSGKPDVVVVDPPRAGLSQKIVRRLLEADAERIVYVSCNPTTLAPNARQMVEAGYELKAVQPVDMFPQTPHIECVALLERS
ncbi:MAG TPA: 23S rRNA (uracil(1939)-C(5))-methyltransferase RlmD, partial [Thermoleophilaceae bacterium]|nr:23S rRNA (uracil(1939)-C(5))-methyltransferase RlmD [Thermoleophilaceae bacterium]